MKRAAFILAVLCLLPALLDARCLLRQSTTKTVRLGPFVDKADGVTELTALSNPAVKLSKNGATIVTRNDAVSVAHDANGYYSVELNATDTNTPGDLLVFSSSPSSYPQAWMRCEVLPSTIYDSMVDASDMLPVNIQEVAGSTNAGTALSKGTLTTVLGTVGGGSTTTSVVTSSLDPAPTVTDQYKGRILIFDRATTTAALRGQAAEVTGSTSGGVLTVATLTTAPASGDTFVIL